MAYHIQKPSIFPFTITLFENMFAYTKYKNGCSRGCCINFNCSVFFKDNQVFYFICENEEKNVRASKKGLLLNVFAEFILTVYKTNDYISFVYNVFPYSLELLKLYVVYTLYFSTDI